MKYTVIFIDEENELVAFTNNILGYYSSESFFGNFTAQNSPLTGDSITSPIEKNSQTNSCRCVNITELPIDNPVDNLFWTLYFDGFKSNDGVGAGCILVNRNGGLENKFNGKPIKTKVLKRN